MSAAKCLPSAERRLRASDRQLLREALEALEFAGCQFFACPGPDRRPKPMASCLVCLAIRRVRRRLAVAS